MTTAPLSRVFPGNSNWVVGIFKADLQSPGVKDKLPDCQDQALQVCTATKGQVLLAEGEGRVVNVANVRLVRQGD